VHRPSIPAYRVYLLVGSVAAGASMLLPSDIDDWGLVPFGLVGGVVVLIAALSGRVAGRMRAAWAAIGAGLIGWGAGEALWALDAGDAAVVVYFAAYTVTLGGVLLLVRRSTSTWDLATAIDWLVYSVGVATVAWMLILDPLAEEGDFALRPLLLASIYPIFDLLLIGLIHGLLLRPGSRSPAMGLLAVAAVGMFASDLAYVGVGLAGTYEPGAVLDIGWYAACLLIPAAALHASARSGFRPVRVEPTFARIRIVALTVASLSAPVALLFEWSRNDLADVPVFAIAAAMLTTLVAIRLGTGMRLLRDALNRGQFLEGRLREQAERDPLVNVLNSAAFYNVLKRVLASGESQSAVLFIDLDDFQAINDAHGHAVGDQLLVGVGRRLQDIVRPLDVVARLGGDEFGILLIDAGEAGAVRVSTALLDALRAPFPLNNQLVYVHASIGIALTKVGDDASDVMRQADVAMFLAKGQGKNRFELFRLHRHAEVLRRLALRAELEDALGEGQFVVHYQPLIGAATLTTVGFEALVRWRHPGRGLLAPDEFIPLAEETGLIVPLGRYVLETACRQAVQWAALDRGPVAMAVNVSGVQLRHPGCLGDVREILARTGIDPGSVTLEVTESALLGELGAVDLLAELHALGVRLAIDDFGTGYSSLSYLARFPVDILKVDRSFVRALGTGSRDELVTVSVIDIARRLRLETVAEGVETGAQRDQLRLLGVDELQGFLFARPMPAEAAGGWVARSVAETRPTRRRSPRSIAAAPGEATT
jgi:diguanylate cyclase (GGDEF)-like protein